MCIRTYYIELFKHPLLSTCFHEGPATWNLLWRKYDLNSRQPFNAPEYHLLLKQEPLGIMNNSFKKILFNSQLLFDLSYLKTNFSKIRSRQLRALQVNILNYSFEQLLFKRCSILHRKLARSLKNILQLSMRPCKVLVNLLAGRYLNPSQASSQSNRKGGLIPKKNTNSKIFMRLDLTSNHVSVIRKAPLALSHLVALL